ncbi:MAG: hypothetical protein V1944_01745 [Candidatus Aenigmatarchaeota archaeon]
MKKFDIEFRHQDRRGKMYYFKFKGKNHLIIFSVKGAPRGGHYHRKDQTHIILSGSFFLRVINVKTKKVEVQKKIKSGDVVTIKAYRSHLFVALEDSLMIEYWKGNYKSIDYPPERKIVKDFLKGKAFKV